MNGKLYKFRPFELAKEIPCRDSYVPGARSGHRVCCDEKNLYVFGGYNFVEASDSHKLYHEVLGFNFASKRWRVIFDETDDDCPEELASSAMLMYGKTLVVFGGTSYPFGMRCSNKITLVSFSEDDKYRIQELPTYNDSMNDPPAQYGMSIVSKDNFMYTVGGTQGFDYTADIYRMDFSTQNWDLVAISRPEIDPDQPIGRYRHEIAIDDRFIYIFGGGTSEIVFDLKTLSAFDLISKKWCKILTYPDPDESYPKPRKCHSLVQHTIVDETFVYIAGGNFSGGPLNDVWRLSLKSRRWMNFRQTSLRTSLFFHDACITPDGCMYIFGGITTNTSRTNNLQKMWVTIPKLSVIAWEALLHYNPRMHMMSKNSMLEKGVPLHFAQRAHS